jgi:hypothetical protein
VPQKTSLPCGCQLAGYSRSGAPRVVMCAKHEKMSGRMNYQQWIRFRDKIIARIKAQ